MSRKLTTTPDGRRIPGYCHHKQSGQAYVRFDGKMEMLGPYDPTEGSASMLLYQRLIAEWRSNGYQAPVVGKLEPSDEQTCREACIGFLDYAESYYSRSEYLLCRQALRVFSDLYGALPVSELKVPQVRVARDEWVKAGKQRTTVNAMVGRIQRAFRWLASEGRIPATVAADVCALLPLKRGRTSAKEGGAKTPAKWEDVEKVLGHPMVGRRVRAMVLFMWHTGARVGETVLLAKRNIDTSESVWIFEPEKHKTEWKGIRRRIAIGPQAQQVLAPWMEGTGTYLFDPREESAELHDVWSQMSEEERKDLKWSNPKPGAVTRDHFDPKVVARVLRTAGAGFTPHQLRHALATRMRLQGGKEIAQLVAGHQDESMTEHYTKTAEWEKIRAAMEEWG